MAAARHGRPRNWLQVWLGAGLVLLVSAVVIWILPVPSSIVAAPSPVETSPPPQCFAAVCADLVQKKFWFQDANNGRTIYGPVPLSSGSVTGDTATPTGNFHVLGKRNDSLTPYAVVFTQVGHNFHAGNVTEPTQGSVVLDEQTAKEFYDAVHIGDTVQVF